MKLEGETEKVRQVEKDKTVCWFDCKREKESRSGAETRYSVKSRSLKRCEGRDKISVRYLIL